MSGGVLFPLIPTRGLADSLGLPKSSRVRIDGGEGRGGSRPSARSSTPPRTSGSSCAITGIEPHLHVIQRPPRPLLRSLEQARRSALAHHDHRPARLGKSVLISETWYNIRIVRARFSVRKFG